MAQDLQKNADFVRRDVGVLWPEAFRKAVSVQRFQPSPALAPFVAHYFVARWTFPEGHEYEVSDVLSLPAVHLLLKEARASIVGLMGPRRALRLRGEGVYAAVRFRPGGFYPFYRRPLTDLRDSQGTATEVFPSAQADFVVQTLVLGDAGAIADRLDALLLSRAPQDDPKLVLIGRILADIEEHPEVTPVALAKRHYLSVRSLQTLFSTYVGVGVKWIGIHQRIVGALERAHRGRPNWTRIAFDLGYSSQSHFNHEFKKVIGLSPTAYEKRLRDHQERPERGSSPAPFNKDSGGPHG